LGSVDPGGGEQAIAGINGSCERIQKTAAFVLQSFEVAESVTVAA
jgi:hypothetical protein